jgi:hypothetical protein
MPNITKLPFLSLELIDDTIDYQLDDLFVFKNESPQKYMIVLSGLIKGFSTEDNFIYTSVINKLKENIKNNAKTLFNEKRLTKNELLYAAYLSSEVKNLLIDLKLVSPNDYLSNELLNLGEVSVDYLNCPLFFTFSYAQEEDLKMLVNNGANFLLKTPKEHPIHPETNFYELAIKAKQKLLVKNLTKILSIEQLKKLETPLLNELRSAKEDKKKHKLLIQAIHENNGEVLSEIQNNVFFYEKALKYKKEKIGKNLLQYALECNQETYVKGLIDLNLYDKTLIDGSDFCYTMFALNKNQPKLALLAYENGYYNMNVIKAYLNQTEGLLSNTSSYLVFAQDLLASQENIKLEVLFHHGFHNLLDEYIDKYKNEIPSFFKTNPTFTQLGRLSNFHSHKVSIINHNIQMTQSKVKFIFKMINYLTVIENENNQSNQESNKYLSEFLESINQNSDEKWNMICLKIGINIFPKKENVIISTIQNEALKIKFEKKLFDNTIKLEEDLVVMPKKKLKI